MMQPDLETRFGGRFPQIFHHFNAYRKKYETIFPNVPRLQKLNSPGLYQNFDKMISVKRPKISYVNSDWMTKGFFGFMKMIPTSWSDKMRIGLMKLPK